MKPIPGAPGYFATKEGSIYSNRTGALRRLNPSPNPEGYLIVALCYGGHRSCRRVHRLVLETFRGPCPQGWYANHKNGIRADNRLENLEWASNRANTLHGKRVRGKPGVSRYRGTQRWEAKIYVDGRRVHLGYFATEDEAYQHYLEHLRGLGDASALRYAGVCNEQT